MSPHIIMSPERWARLCEDARALERERPTVTVLALASAEVNRIHAAALLAIRTAWRSGYLACCSGIGPGTWSPDAADGCADPGDYLDEALDALTPTPEEDPR